MLLAIGCDRPGTQHDAQKTVPARGGEKEESAPVATPAAIQFQEMAGQLGIVFTHVSGNSAEKYFPTANGSGVAVFDYDNDGWLDLYFLTTCPFPLESTEHRPTNRLYQSEQFRRFHDVSVASGLDLALFCHGAAHGDLDNDGFVDLVVTGYTGTKLLHNRGDGTFAPLPTFTETRWGSCVAAADFDQDGDLDLYVSHYGLWSMATNKWCGSENSYAATGSGGDPFGTEQKKVRLYCSPRTIPPTTHALYENRDDLRFADATQDAGIARDDGRGMGVVAADVDLDGNMDLYVANDLAPNFLFLGNGDGTFRDHTEFSGAAFTREGFTQASMGVDCADADRDGLPDLFVTSYRREYNAFYQNSGQASFFEKSRSFGLVAGSLDVVSWGTRMIDFDNDGWLDLFTTTGHTDNNVAQVSPDTTYQTCPRLWKNEQGKFRLVEGCVGPYFEQRHVGRGVAFGDLDNDGRMDIVVNHIGGSPAVLRNRTPADREFPLPWTRLELIGRISNRDAVGTRVTLSGKGLPGTMIEQRTAGASIYGAHDPRLLIGVGKVKKIDKALVRWPCGATTDLVDLTPGREYRLVEPLRSE